MPAIIDGPPSPHFRPLPLQGNADFTNRANAPVAISAEMQAAQVHAPRGACVSWGIPFDISSALVLAGRPVVVNIEPARASWLVFLHTSDIRPLQSGPGGIISPTRGRGHLAEHAADYVVCYAGGTEVRLTIRRRYQVGAFQRGWGENCFTAVAHHKPRPIRAAFEQRNPDWGVTQTRALAQDEGAWVNWLWAWENPHPEKAITGFRFEPVAGALVLSAISTGDVAAQPLRWEPRRKARLILAEGELFQPDLDEDGLLQQVQLDLGQVISATWRPLYPTAAWPETANNQLPVLASHEILLEYTAHPQACFHLTGASGSQILPVARLEDKLRGSPLQPMAPAERLVHLRVVERSSRRPVPVKLHLHGEWGEYLAPVDRHRILNPAWFEDYSADFAHLRSWPERERMHACTYINGETRVRLPLGHVYLEVSKGFEMRPVRQVVSVTPDTHTIEVEIEKVLPWRERGWVSADTHVHFLSPITAMLEGAAEGVNVINLLASQWGELMTNVADFDGRNTWGTAETGGGPQGDGEYLVRVGSENRQHVLGHISLLGYGGPLITPLTTGGPDESALGDPVEALLTDWARQCRNQGGLVVLPHFPDPRAEGAAAILSGDVDAVEMTSWNDLYSGISPYSLSDWYRYLNCGYLVPAVGGTDKMSAAIAVGTVRTYARLAPDQPFTYEAWKAAVRRGETFVTYGPLLDFMVEGRPMGSRIELPAGGGTLNVTWQVASATTPLARVELVVNGEIRESLAVPSSTASGVWPVRVERSAWLALLVRGQYPDQPEMIAAHSSPVMVQVAGTPLLAAADAVTILDQIEGALAYLDTTGIRAADQVYKRMRLALEAIYRTLHNRLHQIGHYHTHPQPPKPGS